MILSDLLGLPVHDPSGARLGSVSDARFVQAAGDAVTEIRLFGLLVSPRSRVSALGYDRRDGRGPAPIAAIERWWHRGTFLVRWDDVAAVENGVLRLRDGYHRYSPLLPEE
jgi:sporulation protein YlmC with PRC-barrel domain